MNARQLWVALVVLIMTAANQALPAQAASVSKYLKQDALKWNKTVINIDLVRPYYARAFHAGIWTAKTGLSKRGKELLKVLNNAASDGLEPSDYLSALPKNIAKLKGDDLVAAELYLSEAFLHFGRDLAGGRTTPSVTDPDIVISRKKVDARGWLSSASKKGPTKVIDTLRPPHREYALLRKLLAKTKNRTKRRQIIVNMERWRWLPRSLGKNHVLVNQAAFEMVTRKGGKTIDRRRVIVGKPYHKTPMFSHAISTVEFNPTWTVPRSIAGNEMLAKLRRNPGYLKKNNYKLYTSWKADAPAMSADSVNWNSVTPAKFPYRIVQQPGENNALGRVKFLFPNRFKVYLHDTPSRKLFSQKNRALSHGCIRVNKPLEFAEKLFSLARGMPAKSKINEMVKSGETTAVKLGRKGIPVHLTYFTVWVDKNGKAKFHKDVYGRDKMVANILFGGV